MLALPVLAMCLAALFPVRAVAQEARQAEPAASADSLYCEQRRLGYWFYCVKPVPAEEPQIAQPPAQVTATQELDAVTGELRELKAQIGRATTELQSLMRNSSAVFCLKKKKM